MSSLEVELGAELDQPSAQQLADVLPRRAVRPMQRGFTVFFTGLSGVGKSAIANVLLVRFLEMGGRPVSLLDADLVLDHLRRQGYLPSPEADAS